MYDGTKWKAFDPATNKQLPQARVSDIYSSRDSTVWFGSDALYSYKNGGWKHYSENEGLTTSNVSCITEDKLGALWLGTFSYGTFRMMDGFQQFRFPNYAGQNWIRDIEIDSVGNIWAATQAGVRKYDGRSWADFVGNFDHPLTEVYSLKTGPKGGIYFGTFSACEYYDGTALSTVSNLSGWQYVNHIAIDTDSSVWIASSNHIRKVKGGSETVFRQSNNMINSRSPKCAVADQKGRVWFGTDKGVARLEKDSTWTFVSPSLLWSITSGIASDDKGIWTVGGQGIFYISDTGVTNMSVANVTTGKMLYDVVLDKDHQVWVGLSDGIARYNGQAWTYYGDNVGLPPSKTVTCIENGQGNSMWFGSNTEGVYKKEGDKWSVITTKQGLQSNTVNDILANGNITWFATNAGVCSFDGSTWKYFGAGQFGENPVAYSLEADGRGNVWVGTQRGIAVYNGIAFDTITLANGLSSQNVISLYYDPIQSTMWASTQLGLTSIKTTSIVTELSSSESSDFLTIGNVYPNPAQSYLTYPASTNPLQILDSQGNSYGKAKEMPGQKLSIDHLPSGLYFLELSSPQGIVYRRFIKQ